MRSFQDIIIGQGYEWPLWPAIAATLCAVGECKLQSASRREGNVEEIHTAHCAHAKDRHTHLQFCGSSRFLVLPYEPVDHVEVVPHGHFLCLEHANHGIGVSAIVLIMRVAHSGGGGHN